MFCCNKTRDSFRRAGGGAGRGEGGAKEGKRGSLPLFKVLAGVLSVDLVRLQSDLGLHCLHLPLCQKLVYETFTVIVLKFDQIHYTTCCCV